MVAHYDYKVVKTINMNKPWNKACYPDGHSWNYSPGALSLGKVTANQTWWSLPEDIKNDADTVVIHYRHGLIAD